MASNDSTVSLLFKLVADSSQARGDFSSFQSFLKSGAGFLKNVFDDFASSNPEKIFKRLKDEAIGLATVLASNSFGQASSASLKELQKDSTALESGIRALGKELGLLPSQARNLINNFAALSTQAERLKFALDIGRSDLLPRLQNLSAQSASLADRQKDLGVSISNTTGSLSGMASVGGIAGVALAALAVAGVGTVAVLSTLAQTAADADEKIFDLTQKTSFSAEALAAMKLSADTSGTSIEKVSGFIANFEKKLGDAAGGNEVLAASFRELGINVEEGLRNPQAAFDQFLIKFNQLNDDAAKVQLLKKIGGSADLIQFLKEGGDGIDSFLQKAKDLGIVLPNTFDAQAADRFNDSITDIRSQFDNLFVTVGRQLLPILQPLLEKVSDILTGMGPQAQGFGEALASATQEGIDTVSALFDLLGEVGNSIQGLFSIIDTGGPDVVSNVEAVNDSFGPIREFIVFITGGVALIEDVVRLAADVIIGAIKSIALALLSIPQGFLSLFGIVSETIDSETKRLGNDIAALNADFDQGLRKTREIGRQIAEARGQAHALAGGFAETEIGPDGRIRPKGTANVRQFTNPGGGGGNANAVGKGSKQKDEAEAEAKAELKLLELAEKQKELIFKAETDAVKLNLAQQLISHQTATEQLIRIEQVRLQARLEFLAEERRQVEASALKGRDKDVKLAELDLKAEEERQRSQQTVNQIREQQRKLDEQAEKEHRQRLLDLALDADKQQIDRIRDLANQRIISSVNAEKRIAEIEQQSFDRRRAALEERKQTVGPDANDYQKLLDEIEKLESERASAVEKTTARIREAREREIADQRAFQQALTQSERDLVAKQIELEAQRIDAAERRATTPTERTAIINARAANERKAEDLRHDQNLASLRQQEDELQAQATTYDEVLRVTELFNQQFEQEQQRHVQAVKELNQQLSEAQAAQDPTSNINLFGITDESASTFDAFKQSALGALGEVAAAGGNFKDVLKGAFSSVASAAQSVLSAFILTGKAGGQVFKQLAADIISSIAIQSAVKAIFEVAEGFAALAVGNAAGAALHFAAAKTYGLVAAGALAVGLGIGAAGGLGGGGNDSQAQGSGAFGGQSRNPQDSQFTFGDVRGKLGPNAEDNFSKIGKGFFGDSLERLREEVVRQGEESRQVALRQIEATGKHADAAEALVSRINSISPEDMLSVAVDRAPEHIGRGLDAATSSNSDVTRNLALKLGVG